MTSSAGSRQSHEVGTTESGGRVTCDKIGRVRTSSSHRTRVIADGRQIRFGAASTGTTRCRRNLGCCDRRPEIDGRIDRSGSASSSYSRRWAQFWPSREIVSAFAASDSIDGVTQYVASDRRALASTLAARSRSALDGIGPVDFGRDLGRTARTATSASTQASRSSVQRAARPPARRRRARGFVDSRRRHRRCAADDELLDGLPIDTASNRLRERRSGAELADRDSSTGIASKSLRPRP